MQVNFFLIVLLCGFAINANAAEENERPGLVLSGYNKESRGCYNFNESISLCFHVHPSFMKLATKNGKILVLNQRLDREHFLLQMSDFRFLGFESHVFAIPADAPASSDELLVYWHRNHGAKYKLSDGDAQLLNVIYQRAMRKLSETREILLIELLSAALAHQKHQVEALTSFHEMCRALLKGLSVQLPAEFEAVDKKSGREKRCADIRSDPNGNNCVGMCGRGCSCWSWVCGNCCYNRGCYQHDLCCARKFTSSYCLQPWKYGFNCRGYGGYPKCLWS